MKAELETRRGEVTTVTELDALPEGSVVIDAFGAVCVLINKSMILGFGDGARPLSLEGSTATALTSPQPSCTSPRPPLELL